MNSFQHRKAWTVDTGLDIVLKIGTSRKRPRGLALRLLPRPLIDQNMSGSKAFQQFAKQLQKSVQSGGGGGGAGGPGKGGLLGAGALAALIGGGLVFNSALFNGTYRGFSGNTTLY